MNRPILRLSIAASMLAIADFAAGEPVTAEPDAFLDYIEATGSQYIDTDVNAETGLKAWVAFSWASGDISGKDWSLLDAAIDNTVSDKRNRFLMCHLYGGGGKPFFGYGVKQRRNPAFSVPFVGGPRCEIITDMTDPDSLELYQDGVKTFSEEDLETFKTNGVVNLNLNLYVFACHLSNKAAWFSQGKLYELKIWKKNAESGELDLVRHYLPCAKGGRAGLYDEVEGKIYYSFSDDNFIAGAVTNGPSLTDPEGNAITNPDVLDWIEHYGATQEDIDALGTNDRFDELFLLDLDPTKNCEAELRISSIRIEDGMAYVGVALTRTENNVPVGTRKINGTLTLLGRADLATGSFSVLDPDDFDSRFEYGNTADIGYELPAWNPPAFFKVVVE